MNDLDLRVNLAFLMPLMQDTLRLACLVCCYSHVTGMHNSMWHNKIALAVVLQYHGL